MDEDGLGRAEAATARALSRWAMLVKADALDELARRLSERVDHARKECESVRLDKDTPEKTREHQATMWAGRASEADYQRARALLLAKTTRENAGREEDWWG